MSKLLSGMIYLFTLLLLVAQPATADEAATPELHFKVRQQGLKSGPTRTPDGKITVKAEGLMAQLYDVAMDKPIGPPLEHRQRRPNMGIVTWAFSPNGLLVAIASGDRSNDPTDTVGEVRVWAVPSGKLVAALTDAQANLGYVRAVAFSEDGKTVLIDCQEISGK